MKYPLQLVHNQSSGADGLSLKIQDADSEPVCITDISRRAGMVDLVVAANNHHKLVEHLMTHLSYTILDAAVHFGGDPSHPVHTEIQSSVDLLAELGIIIDYLPPWQTGLRKHES